MPEIKFPDILRSLINEQGYSRNRGALLDAAGLTSAALSQYLTGRTRPSFEKLVLLADFFGVSIDYLVFGQRTVASPVAELQPLSGYLRDLAGDLQSRASRHTAMVARLTRALTEEIDAKAAALIDSGTSPGGMVTDPEVFTLEGYSLCTYILSTDLAYDLGSAGGDEDDVAPGMFTGLVANNIRRGNRYQFLVPGTAEQWRSKADALRRLLRNLVGDGDAVAYGCGIRVVDSKVFSGIGLYQLDRDALLSQQRLIYEQVQEFMDEEGWLGYVIPPNPDFRGDLLLDREALQRARGNIDALWRSGKSI